ncbi:MAG: hypothetical protein PVH61_42670 [Candidatus Aminicenantes bacterium]|jgi:hypothetical protein
MTLTIEVKNNFKRGKRGIIVHDSSQKQNWIVPWEKNGQGDTKQEFDFPGGKDDYLVIAVTPGAGDLKWCKAELPTTLPFIFIPGGMEKIGILTSSDGERTTLRIPPGPPTWQLKIKNHSERMAQSADEEPGSGEGGGANVSVGDDGPGGWD